jgi:hypothetical protein
MSTIAFLIGARVPTGALAALSFGCLVATSSGAVVGRQLAHGDRAGCQRPSSQGCAFSGAPVLPATMPASRSPEGWARRRAS